MMVRVQLFAVARQLAGHDAVEIELADGATVSDLRRALGERVPALAGLLGHLAFAVNAAYAADSTLIPPRADVACIPPVSGG
jgi:molybdopterin synthase sulfur carrier subunit